MDFEKLFEPVHASTHGNAKQLVFQRMPCETIGLDGKMIEGPCIICVSHQPNKSGYPQLRFEGKNWRLHRLAWTRAHGPIPEGFEVDHICRNIACINPSHLQLLTKTFHLAKTEMEAEMDGEYEDREAAIVLMQLEPEISRAALADEFGVKNGTSAKWKMVLIDRNENCRSEGSSLHENPSC
jgi:hypothetical protein